MGLDIQHWMISKTDLTERFSVEKLTEQEAWEELQDAAARERYEQEMNDYMQQQMMEEEPYLF